MRLLLLLLGLTLCTSCVRKERDDFVIADAIIAQNNRRIESEGFDRFLTGGSFRNTIRRIAQGYISKTLCFSSVDQARPFIVKQVQEFIQPFNEEKRIRMYLQNFPFTAKNLELTFCFQDTEKVPLPRRPPNLAIVACVEGVLRYSLWDEKSNHFQLIHSESYADACLICAKNKIE